MFSFNKTLLIPAAMIMLAVGEVSARMGPSSSVGKQQEPLARKLADCTVNCGSCTNDNVEVTFLDFLDLTIIDTFWQGIVICLPLALAKIADQINLGTCCAEDGRGGVAQEQGRPILESEEGPLN